jgi:hypothetical protein
MKNHCRKQLASITWNLSLTADLILNSAPHTAYGESFLHLGTANEIKIGQAA